MKTKDEAMQIIPVGTDTEASIERHEGNTDMYLSVQQTDVVHCHG